MITVSVSAYRRTTVATDMLYYSLLQTTSRNGMVQYVTPVYITPVYITSFKFAVITDVCKQFLTTVKMVLVVRKKFLQVLISLVDE